jgi:hypothetical protein
MESIEWRWIPSQRSRCLVMLLRTFIRRYLAKKRTTRYQISRSKHFDIKSSNLYLDEIASVDGRLQVSAARIRVPFVLRITNPKFSIRASKPRNIQLTAKFLVVVTQERLSHLRLSTVSEPLCLVPSSSFEMS